MPFRRNNTIKKRKITNYDKMEQKAKKWFGCLWKIKHSQSN